MDTPVVIRGTFTNQVFVPEGPLPKIEGRAELIVYEHAPESEEGDDSSLFDLFGKAPHLRSAEDIDAQLRAERDSWDDT
jgi:hypothetical protein